MRNIVLQGDKLSIPTELPDQTILAEAYKADKWPHPQLCRISDNEIHKTNKTTQTILIDSKNNATIKLTES